MNRNSVDESKWTCNWISARACVSRRMTSLTTMFHGKTPVDLCMLWNMSNIAWPPGLLAIWCRSKLDMRRRAVASSQAKTLSGIRVRTHPAAKN